MLRLDAILLVNTLFPLGTETEVTELPKTNSAVGIDVGIKRLCDSFRWHNSIPIRNFSAH